MGVLADNNYVNIFVHDIFGNLYMINQLQIENEILRDFHWDVKDETKFFVVGYSAYPQHRSM